MDKEITCCFTGHRNVPAADAEMITSQTEHAIRMLYGRGYRIFICGGAIGYDQLCAETVLRLKRELIDIKLRLILPCGDQDKYFSFIQKAAYQEVKLLADSVEVMYPAYVRTCMHERNRKMVGESSACIAYLKKNYGGTAYTVQYAQQNGLIVYRVGI